MPTIQEKKGAPKPRGQNPAVRHDKVLMQPGEYEVTKSSTFTLRLPLRKNEDNWWVVVSEDEAETVEEVVFRMWAYDEMVELRKLATKTRSRSSLA